MQCYVYEQIRLLICCRDGLTYLLGIGTLCTNVYNLASISMSLIVSAPMEVIVIAGLVCVDRVSYLR